MPNYLVLTDSTMVFPALTRASGETLEASRGDVVALHPDVPADVIEGFVAAGMLEPTAASVSPAPGDRAAVADPAEVKRVKRQLAAQVKAAEKKAAAEQQAAKATSDAAEAGDDADEGAGGEHDSTTEPTE